MNPSKERNRGRLTEGTASDSRELDELKTKIQDMQLEINILKQTLLKKLKIAKSSYYIPKITGFAEKHKGDCQVMTTIFREHMERYGYRRIKAILKREGHILSEKVIRRIICENGLHVKSRSARKCCPYKGEISLEVQNKIQRKFRADDSDLIRSTSWKGCLPDNAACEGFFGRMKNEMFYSRSWQGVTLEEFMQQIEAYMMWYRDIRTKLSLGRLGPVEYRTKMGLPF